MSSPNLRRGVKKIKEPINFLPREEKWLDRWVNDGEETEVGEDRVTWGKGD